MPIAARECWDSLRIFETEAGSILCRTQARLVVHL